MNKDRFITYKPTILNEHLHYCKTNSQLNIQTPLHMHVLLTW